MRTEGVSGSSVQKTAVGRFSSFWNRRGIVTTSVVLSILGAGVCLAPTVITATSLRNHLLNSAIGNDGLTATAESATGGWFAALVFRNVRVENAEGNFLWTVKEVRTSNGLLALMTAPTQIGEVRLTESSLKVQLNADGQWPLHHKPKPSKSELSFRIEDGSLEVSVPWREIPIVELSHLTIAGNIGLDANSRRTLNIEPIQVLDNAPLSESHTQQNLALIAPVLSQSTTLSGSASVWLEAIQIPLDEDAVSDAALEGRSDTEKNAELPFPIHGRAEFHSLEARLKDVWIQQLTAVIGQAGGVQLPNRIQVLKDSTVDFSVSREGISHDGMAFLLPELAQELTFTSSGVVRLDETLDLLLTLTFPEVVSSGHTVMAYLGQLTETPIQFRVVGKVSEPKLRLPEGMDLLKSLTSRIAPAQHTEGTPPLPSTVLDLIQNVGSQDREKAKADLPGNILNLIRAVDEQARQKRKERKSRRE